MYKQAVFNSTYELVNFLNDNNISISNIVTVMPIHTEAFLIYNLIYLERQVNKIKKLYYHNRLIAKLIIKLKFKNIRRDINNYVNEQKEKEPKKNHIVYCLNEDDFINLFDKSRIESFGYLKLNETQIIKSYLYPSKFAAVIEIGIESLSHWYHFITVRVSDQDSKNYYIHIYVRQEEI